MGRVASTLPAIVPRSPPSLTTMAAPLPFPDIKSKHSLVAKYVTKEIWDKLCHHKTATSGFTLAKAISCSVEFDNQHCGIYAGDWDSYKDQRLGVENLMKTAFKKLEGDLSGNYYPLTGMDETIRQQLVDDHFLFMSGDPNLKVAGMERDWPE